MKDLFGKALQDYFDGNYSEDLITATHISYEDVLPLPYLFRDYEAMPGIERKALDLSYGHVLDVGCGAGSHSLYLQSKGLTVTAIDNSPGAVSVCKKRGIKDARLIDVLDLEGSFDTILLMMNGTGLFQTLEKAPIYLKKLRNLVKSDGQILLDASDISYMYDEEDLEWVKQSDRYYGELDFSIKYKGEEEIPTTWLYLDFEKLKILCEDVGLNCELQMKGEHFDYLARLTL